MKNFFLPRLLSFAGLMLIIGQLVQVSNSTSVSIISKNSNLNANIINIGGDGGAATAKPIPYVRCESGDQVTCRLYTQGCLANETQFPANAIYWAEADCKNATKEVKVTRLPAPATFEEALAAIQALGGRIASVLTAEQFQAAVAALQAAGAETAWLDLHIVVTPAPVRRRFMRRLKRDAPSADTYSFVTSSGKNVTLANLSGMPWADGQPNANDGECVAIDKPDAASNYSLTSLPCNSLLQFVIEESYKNDGAPPANLPKPPTTPPTTAPTTVAATTASANGTTTVAGTTTETTDSARLLMKRLRGKPNSNIRNNNNNKKQAFAQQNQWLKRKLY